MIPIFFSFNIVHYFLKIPSKCKCGLACVLGAARYYCFDLYKID